MDDDRENPDFIECANCGGEYYKGDLDCDGYCAECREIFDDALGLDDN